MAKCKLCEKEPKDKRLHFFEIIWKCDLILSRKISEGLLCEKCQLLVIDKIHHSIDQIFKEKKDESKSR